MSAVDLLIKTLLDCGIEPAVAAVLVARAGSEMHAEFLDLERDDRHDASRSRHDASRSKEAVRAARYRKNRKQNQTQDVDCGVALAATIVTTDRHDASRRSVTDATLTSLSIKEKTPNEVKEENKREKALSVETGRRGSRMTAEWEPGDGGMKFAAEHGLRLFEIDIETTKFRNYWLNRTDRQGAKPRWDLCWQNWILNARKGQTNGTHAHRGKSLADAADDLIARAAGATGKGPLIELTVASRGGDPGQEDRR